MIKVNDLKSLPRSVIAAAFKMSAPNVNQWVRRGCPRNPNGSYSLPDVIAWRFESALTNDTAPDPEAAQWLAAFRKERFKRARFERRILEDKYILAAEVEKSGFEAGKMIKDHCQSIPERCAALVASESDIFRCKTILAAEIHVILEKLSAVLMGFK